MPSQAERASVLENDRPVARAVLIERNGQRRQGPYRSISIDDVVVRHERHHEIITITMDRYCSLWSLKEIVVRF